MHSVTCGEDVDEPWVRDRCSVPSCKDPYTVLICEKCPSWPVGHYFACPSHMQEHHDDCHSYKRSVLGARYCPEAEDLHMPEASATQGAVPPRVPALRMGNRPLSVGGERGGRGGRGNGVTRGPPQGRPIRARLASVARIPIPNQIFVPNSRDVHYRISPVGDAHNRHDHPRPHAAVVDGNGGRAAPLGGPPTHTYTTHQNKKALMAGASLP
jgi:hypothetical protein